MSEDARSEWPDGKIITGGASVAPHTWQGLQVKYDDSLPPNTIEIRDAHGRLLASYDGLTMMGDHSLRDPT